MAATIDELTRLRAEEPHAVAAALATRTRPARPSPHRQIIIAADLPARGVLRAGEHALAMANRRDLLSRLLIALRHPAVTGVLAAPDIVEDLALLGALEGKVVIGAMNQGGVTGTAFEIDDRFTAYDAAGIEAAGLEAGKMLLRIDPTDPLTAGALDACAKEIDGLAASRRVAVVQPVIARKMGGRVVEDLELEPALRAVSIASALGRTSAYTWLMLPVSPDLPRVLDASTLPVLLLRGDPGESSGTDPALARALGGTTVRGVVVGRSVLYPRDGDVGRAVASIAELV